jgi:aspartate aminotransferase-like enzyme
MIRAKATRPSNADAEGESCSAGADFSATCYMIDTISSLLSIDLCMDEWGVDVIVAGS